VSDLLGIDELDRFTSEDPRDHGHVVRPAEGTDFAASCGPDGLRGLRIGVGLLIIISFNQQDFMR